MKKFLSYMFSFIMCLTVLSGCNLFELNKAKFYSQIVVSIEYKDNTPTKKFTMEDLLSAYNNYGYQYAQNGEMTGEQALDKTAEVMVQRYMLVEKIKKEITLSTAEIESLKRETYNYINQNLLELEKEVRVEWDRVTNEPDKVEPEETQLRAAYTPYEPKIERKFDSNGMNPKLERVIEEEKVDGTPAGEFVQNITDEDVSKEAMKRYLKNLETSNENLGKKVKENELLQNEIDRIYKILEENKYISKYQTELTNSFEINSEAAVNAYKEKYKRDYELYSTNEAAYHKAMGEDASKVYYHPNSGNEYMWVTHILFKFSDEQTAKIEALKAQLKSNDIEQKVYDEQMANLTSMDNTIVKYVVNGETKTTNATLAFEDIKNNVLKYNAEYTFTERAKAFNDYIYKYNDDEGIMNKDFAYVVNLDTNVEDKMVKEFADEARDLFKLGAGAMSAAPVQTEYGYHVLLNLGPVKNVVEYPNIDNITWQTLYNVKTQPSSEKTLFHYEYDSLNLDENGVTNYVNNVIADLTATLKVINYHKKEYHKLLTIN